MSHFPKQHKVGTVLQMTGSILKKPFGVSIRLQNRRLSHHGRLHQAAIALVLPPILVSGFSQWLFLILHSMILHSSFYLSTVHQRTIKFSYVHLIMLLLISPSQVKLIPFIMGKTSLYQLQLVILLVAMVPSLN